MNHSIRMNQSNLYQICYIRAPGQEERGGGGNERIGILPVDVYKRVGNLSFGSVKAPKELTDEFYGFKKSRKRSIF